MDVTTIIGHDFMLTTTSPDNAYLIRKATNPASEKWATNSTIVALKRACPKYVAAYRCLTYAIATGTTELGIMQEVMLFLNSNPTKVQAPEPQV